MSNRAPAKRIGTSIDAAADTSLKFDDWFRTYDQRTRGDASIGSDCLREACLKLFWKFAVLNRISLEDGERLQLDGYRS